MEMFTEVTNKAFTSTESRIASSGELNESLYKVQFLYVTSLTIIE